MVLLKTGPPGHCYGSSKNGPYGPQGPWAQPLFDCVAVPSGGFFSGKKASKKTKRCLLLRKSVYLFEIVAILANVDLNLRLQNCKIAI